MTLAIYPLKTHLKWTCYSYYKHTQERHSMAPNICTTLRWHHLRTRTHDCCVLYLLHDSLLIVVAQGATELVVVHGRTVLLHAPQPGNLSRGGGGGNVCGYTPGSVQLWWGSFCLLKESGDLHAFEGLSDTALLIWHVNKRKASPSAF